MIPSRSNSTAVDPGRTTLPRRNSAFHRAQLRASKGLRRSSAVASGVILLILLAVPPATGSPARSGEETGNESQSELAAFLAAGTPGPEHRALADLVGELALEARFWATREQSESAPELTRQRARRRLILDGRVLELSVGSIEQDGFAGHGLLGFDRRTGEHWYAWTDTTTTGLERYRGRLEADGSGWLEGARETPAGRERVRVEIRLEEGVEIHDYFARPDGEKPWRFLELRYRLSDGITDGESAP